jgi:protein-L-isoaspartate(D-aspartate) O-methyltransferase
MNTKPTESMLRDIRREVEFTRHEIGRDHLDERVMEAIRAVPRHEFVPLEARPYAYENGPVAIGHGQTISQPYIVALMSDLLRPRSQDVVLEVGAGSGYQAAVLSRLVRQVYSVEIIEALASQVAERMQRLGYHNVEVRHGDGYYGWPEHAPFDGIIVTAAAPHIPPPLIEQLKVGGRLVIPVGQPLMYQELKVVEKTADDKTQVRDVLGVAFVPLVGGHSARSEEL